MGLLWGFDEEFSLIFKDHLILMYIMTIVSDPLSGNKRVAAGHVTHFLWAISSVLQRLLAAEDCYAVAKVIAVVEQFQAIF